MIDHIDVPIVATGDWIDAAWINQYIGDNVRAWRQGFVAAGDMAYALDANTIAALNKPSIASLLTMDSSGVPSWAGKTSLAGLLHTSGSNFTNSNTTSTSTSYVALGAGVSFNLTLSAPCTIVAWAHGVGYKVSGTYLGYFAIAINGTIDPNDNVRLKGTSSVPYSTMYKVASVPAGTRTVELKYKTENAGDAVGNTSCILHALAFME